MILEQETTVAMEEAVTAWRSPELAELVEYLTSSCNVIRVNAAAYLQHLTFGNDDVKAQIAYA